MSKYNLFIRYERVIEPEDRRIEGNVMVSGDPEVDREQEDWTYAQLDAGNEAAWCYAHVRAILTFTAPEEWYGSEGDAYLGGCSYGSERELWESLAVDYDLESEARAEAERTLRRQIPTGPKLKVFNRLMKKLERDETLKRLMDRQKRATEALTDGDPYNRRWAETELVHVDEALEKLT